MLAFIRDANTSRSVTDIFNSLYEILGHEKFTELFSVILADRGSEFTNPAGIECSSYGELQTKVFYTDPMRPNQKDSCEAAHEMIRRILPKGKFFDNLTQEDVSLMMSHINSYKRKKLGDKSAYELFSFIHGGDVLLKLQQVEIPVNKIQITPKLLKNNASTLPPHCGVYIKRILMYRTIVD